jgi:hypothetical protein
MTKEVTFGSMRKSWKRVLLPTRAKGCKRLTEVDGLFGCFSTGRDDPKTRSSAGC